MRLDERAIHENNMRRSVEDKLKTLPPEEIFMVLTQSGREVLMPLIEDTIRKVVGEVFDEKLKFHLRTAKTQNRKDAWTIEEDNTLTDIVNDHMLRGSTKQLAYAEASRALGRTVMACGYRWNHHITKKDRV